MHEGARLPSVWRQSQGQIYLGSEAFVKKMRIMVDKKPSLSEIPRAQRRVLKQALSDFADEHPRDEPLPVRICPAAIRWPRLRNISVYTTQR